jgi:hypothetical protein
MMRKIRIRFDGPPGPQGGRFIETEDAYTGSGVGVGWWERDGGGDNWFLHLEIPDDQVRD